MAGWLKNKTLVVIGGTAGIGLAAAEAFIREEAQVLVVGNAPETLDTAARALGSKGHVLEGDATQELTAARAIRQAIVEFGSFDGLYHVAGGSGRRFGDGPLDVLTPEGWNETFRLNLTSLMLSNQAAVRQWQKQKTGGSLLNISSVLGYSPSPDFFSTHAYAAAKAAVIGFSKSVASYYARDGIRVNVLAPGLVETPMSKRAASDPEIMAFVRTKQPLDGGRIGQPDDLTGAAVYLLSDYARFTTGQVLAVDGGWTVSEGQKTA